MRFILGTMTAMTLNGRSCVYRSLMGAAVAALLCPAASFSALPDLIINRQLTANTIYTQMRTFTSSDCAVIEGCMNNLGRRKLLRFAVGFVNIGKGDLVVGRPQENPNAFEYSPCHGHYHFEGAASYALYNASGAKVRASQKQAFCLLDYSKYAPHGRSTARYTCEDQGISAGWQDVYTKALDCQWLDITGLRPGRYTLRITVNPLRKFRESNYGNNSASIPITIR